MAYTKEDFERFSQKLEDIRNSKKEDFIQPKDWLQIAEEIGFPTSELQNIQNSYYDRGIGHLQHQNWDEALIEFQNYLVFNPLNAEANALLAETYLEKWKETNKRKDAEQAHFFADKCLEIDPKYKKAFQIIQQLNKKAKSEKIYKKTGKFSIRIPEQVKFFLFIVTLVFIVLAPSIYYTWTYKAPLNITFYQTIGNEKKVLYWMLTYDEDDGSKYNYQIQVLEAQTGKLITKFPISPSAQNFKYVNGKFYYSTAGNDFEARDAFTGELVDNKKILASHFKELEQGIGDIYIRGYEQNHVEIHLKRKDGVDFIYRPITNQLILRSEADQYDYNLKNWIPAYTWVNIRNNKNSSESQFFLFQTQMKPSGSKILSENTIMTPDSKDGFSKRISLMSPNFLEATAVFSDSSMILIKHKNEVSKDAKLILTCLDSKGKVVWELKEEQDSESEIWPMLRGNHSPSYLRTKDVLIISNTYFRTKKIKDAIALSLAIDIKTGKILWKYSPNLKLEK